MRVSFREFIGFLYLFWFAFSSRGSRGDKWRICLDNMLVM
ncbi:hypothetical protein DKAM_0762 [Desulfurococcus amylolyticus 1221n]|uniref:Uncharacterized protein n=1 Tax=Desulfurococcus amylolyticus (strain DSM 18924 / JCM 16383 / VKM B-2413 / 1221n) TaxID=490899 RepID=B8D4Q7_DESA1|nr:hypothetical protein DKAM_0762 [Desulfurococcus amylolyticus 1221n]